jgi:hypothetical protein
MFDRPTKPGNNAFAVQLKKLYGQGHGKEVTDKDPEVE